MNTSGPLPPGGFEFQGQPISQAPARKHSRLLRWLLICGIVLAVGMCALCATCIYIGTMSPDTKVLSGRQVPARFMSQIRDLGLLEPGETILYFYSDGLLNIEEGMYLVTDRKVAIYDRTLDEPALMIPFSEIVAVEADFTDTWFEDSSIELILADDTSVWFPVSNEGGGDKRVYETLKKKCEAP